MIVKLLSEHHLKFLSLKGGCRGSSESTLVKMSNRWKSLAVAHFLFKPHCEITFFYCIQTAKVQISMCIFGQSDQHFFYLLTEKNDI